MQFDFFLFELRPMQILVWFGGLLIFLPNLGWMGLINSSYRSQPQTRYMRVYFWYKDKCELIKVFLCLIYKKKLLIFRRCVRCVRCVSILSVRASSVWEIPCLPCFMPTLNKIGSLKRGSTMRIGRSYESSLQKGKGVFYYWGPPSHRCLEFVGQV